MYLCISYGKNSWNCHVHGSTNKFATNDCSWIQKQNELFMQQSDRVCEFLTKKEILTRFALEGVSISFDYRFIEAFDQTIQRLINESESDIVLCVTHREGMKNLDNHLQYSDIRYCALVKYSMCTAHGKLQHFEIC
eukprot:431477_1